MRKSQLLIVISYLLFVNNWKKLFVIVPQITPVKWGKISRGRRRLRRNEGSKDIQDHRCST